MHISPVPLLGRWPKLLYLGVQVGGIAPGRLGEFGHRGRVIQEARDDPADEGIAKDDNDSRSFDHHELFDGMWFFFWTMTVLAIHVVLWLCDSRCGPLRIWPLRQAVLIIVPSSFTGAIWGSAAWKQMGAGDSHRTVRLDGLRSAYPRGARACNGKSVK